jgi:Ca2+-binding EF-hand superfamily protein
MQASTISKTDILDVADFLKVQLTEKEVEQILKEYDAHAQGDPTASWNLIVEDMIYHIIIHNNDKPEPDRFWSDGEDE